MEKELEQLQEKEEYDVKYISELRQYWNAYMYALINEIYVGVGINLGLKEKEAYNLSKNPPKKMEKAGFFKSIFDKFKNIFKYKVPKFRPKKSLYNEGKPMTDDQWDTFNNSLKKYWTENANKVAEDIGIKAHMLGRETTNFRQEKKPYKNKSLYQVEFDQYDGEMPDNIAEAYNNYDFTNSEKRSLNKSMSDIAMYVTKTNTEIQEAIREQVQIGLDNNKSSIEIASDLYWNVQKNENLVNKYTAESMRKNWNRIASTEMASVYEAGVLGEYESEAVQSLKDPKKAQYFVFTGGSCPWCRAHQGVLVRLVPLEVVADTRNDSLKSMGIKDPNTDIAIWVGKNNIGYRETKTVHEFRVCTPAHPYNVATFQPIDIENETYNKKTGRVEKRHQKKKYVPPQVDYSIKSKEEKDWRKPTFVGSNLVRYNNNLYEAVDGADYNRKLDEWKKDPQKPIPVERGTTRYTKIFEEAEKNKEE